MGRQAGVLTIVLSAHLLKPGSIAIRELPIPAPSEGEILLKVEAALTCGTDLKAYKRGHALIPMPGPFGHEFSGTVAAKGKGTRRFKDGDPIMAVHTAPCMRCSYCGRGLHNLCENIMQSKVLGAYAEYLLLPAHVVKLNTFKKPRGVSPVEAALLEPLSCVLHSVRQAAQKKDTLALVMGAGPMGLLHLMLLRQKGITVAISDPNAGKLRIAKSLGAAYTLAPETLAARTRKIAKDHGGFAFDCLFECTGRPEVWEQSLNHVRRGATVVLFGGLKEGHKVCYDSARLHYDEITLKGVFHFTPKDVQEGMAIINEKSLPLHELITGSYPLRQTEKAFLNLSKGKGIKYAIVP